MSAATSRRADRRNTIAAGALTVLSQRGSHGLTHRAVDVAAGLPQGSTSYYFNARADLLVAASDALFELDKAEFLALHDEQGALDVEGLLSSWLSPLARDRLLARLELFLEAARNPDFRAHLTHQRAFFQAATQKLMARRGVKDPDEAADRAIAQFEGELLRRAAFTSVFD